MEKINVCLIAPSPKMLGGISNWVNLITSYEQEYVNFKCIYNNTNANPAKGRSLFNRIFGNGLVMLKNLKELKKEYKKGNIDCIHLTTSGSLGLIRDKHVINFAKKKNIGIVYHLHFGRVPEIMKKNNWECRLLQKNIKNATSCVAIDTYTYNTLVEKFGDCKIKIIPNPIDAIDLKCNSDLKNICFVGWVVDTKGINELVEAWNELGKKYTDWTLNIVGPYSKKTFEMLKKSIKVDNLNIVGEMSHADTLKFMSANSIFILPSYTEGFTNAILEAMMLQMAIIATDVGEIKNMIENNGILIEPKNVLQIKEALCKLIQDPTLRREFGSACKKKVMEKYTTEVVFKQLFNLWKTSV